MTIGDDFRVLASTIHWLGKDSTPHSVAAEILRRSRAERTHSRRIAEICTEMTGGAPLPFVRDAESFALAESVMAAAL